MSSIKLAPNASGTGEFTIAAPNSNTNRTFNLPDESGTVLINGTNSNVGIGTTSPDLRLTLQSSGDAQLSFKDTGGISRGFIGTAGAFGSAPTGALRLRSDQGGIVFGQSGFENARINTSGSLLVGTTTGLSAGSTTPATGIDLTSYGTIIQSLNTTNALRYVTKTAGGTTNQYFDTFFVGATNVGWIISTNGTTLSYQSASDYRLKEDVRPMTGALVKVAALKPCTYKWKSNGAEGDGFIAHELAEVCPQAVSGDKDAVDADGNPVYQGIDTSFLVATLTAAIQEQQAMIQTLTARIEALESK